MSPDRNVRVADSVRRALAHLLQERVRDPQIGFVTVTDVKLSPDLRHAVVYVTVIDAERWDETLSALERATPFLRRSLSRDAGLRFTPSLCFVYDEAAARGARVDDLLDRIDCARGDDTADGEEPR